MNGFSFALSGGEGAGKSEWLSPDRMFSVPEFLRRYDEVSISLFTPKCTLVPSGFFDEGAARETLSSVCTLREADVVSSVALPEYGAVLVYSNSIDEALSRAISQMVLTTSGEAARVLPELYYVIRSLSQCQDYNKIVASWRDGCLCLAMAQGKNLLLCNCFDAADFTTAEYYIFLAMKKLQLNPEVSSICFRTPLGEEEELSLYRYFRAVEAI